MRRGTEDSTSSTDRTLFQTIFRKRKSLNVAKSLDTTRDISSFKEVELRKTRLQEALKESSELETNPVEAVLLVSFLEGRILSEQATAEG